MNNKITLPQLAQLVADKNGHSIEECKEVLRLLFQNIAAALEGGENVKIKGFGTFKLTNVEARKSVDVASGQPNEIPAHRRIIFIPTKDLASAVNAPFEMFETIVICENLLEDELMQASTMGNAVEVTETEEKIIEEEKEMDALKKEYPVEFGPKVQEIPDETPEEEDTIEDTQEEESIIEEAREEEKENKEDESKEELVEEPGKGKTEENGPEADVPEPDVSEESVTEEDETHADETGHQFLIPEYNSEDQEPSREFEKKSNRAWLVYIIIALLVLLGGCAFCVWYFDLWPYSAVTKENNVKITDKQKDATEFATLLDDENNISEENTDITGIVEEEEIPDNKTEISANSDNNNSSEKKNIDEPVPTQPSDKKADKSPVYDTVTQTRYLTTIAKEHYGNYHLWPYIYKENEKILGHPNRIRPGTKVVVPDLKKYGVDPKNPDDIAKAKTLGAKIYEKYQ